METVHMFIKVSSLKAEERMAQLELQWLVGGCAVLLNPLFWTGVQDELIQQLSSPAARRDWPAQTITPDGHLHSPQRPFQDADILTPHTINMDAASEMDLTNLTGANQLQGVFADHSTPPTLAPDMIFESTVHSGELQAS